MKKLIFALVLFSQIALAQKISIKGQVLDGENKPLPSATVILLNPTDSSLVNFGATKADGFFELKNVNKAEYMLRITFVGHKTFSYRVIPTADQTVFDIGVAKMEEAKTELDEVVVQGDKAPVEIKGDTIVFNATTFKTKQNDNVEELLKKLPGVEVENDGTIKAQGEEVKKVTVDGREFFGRDPKLATRNLPADAVEKVQVFDKQSDQAEFTGIDDGQREKTINLELKEEKRNGVFGNVMGGYGTDNRYTAKASLNRFKKGQQLSFIGQGNNINEQGFSIGDYLNYSGGLNSGGGGGGMRIQIDGGGSSGIPLNTGGRQNGLMTNYAAGLNFSDVFNKKTELTSSYFYNYIDHDLDKTTNRISYTGESEPNLLYSENTSQNNNNSSHKVNLTLDHKMDSLNSFILRSNFSYNDTEVQSQFGSSTGLEDGTKQIENIGSTYGAGDTWALNNNLLFRHRFNKKGRTLSSNLIYNITETDNVGTNFQDITYFKPSGDSIVELRQRNLQDNLTQNYGVNASYTEPLGGRKYLEMNYAIRLNDSQIYRDVYDIEDSGDIYNTLLSNRYLTKYLYQRAGANLKFNHKDYTLTIGAAYQFTNLNGELRLSDTDISKSFNNILPSVYFNYNFTSTKRLNFNYETSVQEPSVQQLSPVIDNSNSLNLYVGNPDLEPEYNHRWMVNYTMFNPSNFTSFFARANATYTTNAIVNSQYFDDEYRTIAQPVNLGESFNVNGNLSFGFPINVISSRLNINANGRHSTSMNFLRGEESNIKQETLGGNIRYEYRFKEVFDISLRANLSNQVSRYDNGQDDQSFLNQTYGAEGNLTFLKHFNLNSTFDYLVYANQAGGETQKIPLLNISLSRYILKAQSGEIKLAVVNLLDKSLGVTQTANANYVERQVMNSLGRYVMVSFTYALNKQLNPMAGMGGRRGPRMMMIRDN